VELAVFLMHALQRDVTVPHVGKTVIYGGKGGERKTEDLPERPTDILQQPLALAREQKECDEQAGEQDDGETPSAVC